MRWPARRAIRHAPLTILCPERIAARRQASHRSLVRLIAERTTACMIDQRTATVGVVVIMVQIMLPFADRHTVASRHRIAVVGTVFVGVLATVLFFHSIFFRQRQKLRLSIISDRIINHRLSFRLAVQIIRRDQLVDFDLVLRQREEQIVRIAAGAVHKIVHLRVAIQRQRTTIFM